MFFDRFFRRSIGELRNKRRSSQVGPRLRMEPLEDRSLLSITPGLYVGPLPHHQTADTYFGVFAPGGMAAGGPAAFQDAEASEVVVALDSNGSSTVVATHLILSMSAGATIGAPVTVRHVAEDALNHFVPDYTGTVDLSSSDPNATLPANITFQHGHASFQVTFATEGQQTVTATDTSDSTLTATVTTNVANPAVATHFVLYMPSGTTVGTPATVQIVAEDADNQFVGDYTGTVDLSSSDASATLPASVTFVHGHASFHVTFGTAGLQTVTATDNTDSSLTGTTTTNVTTPAVATHFALSIPQGVATGASITVHLVTEDAQNNIVSGYAGTANLSSSDSGAALPTTVTFQNGRASFKATFATAGQQTVTAVDATDAALTGMGTTNVAIQHFVLHLPQGVTIGVPVTVQLAATDAQNNLMLSYSGTANLASSDALATLPANVTFENGRASFQVTFGTQGQQTVTATDSVNASPIGTATTNVAAANVATHFVVYLTPGTTVGTPVTVRVVPEDAQNHIVSGYMGTVNLSSSDSGATLPASITFQQGHAAFFQVNFANQGLQTVTATDSTDATLTGTATTNVATPAVVTHFVVYTRFNASLGIPATVLIVAEDAQNHVVPNYTGTVNLETSDGGATLPASVTLQNGYAKVHVTFATLGAQTVTATDSVDPSLTGTATTNVADNSGSGGRNWFSRFRW